MSDTQMKHAYLIMAHTNFEQLQTLIDLLDDPRNDLYLHIDKKSKNVPVFSAKRSNLYLVDPISVVWAGHSQIHCELLLMKAAGKGHYRYYHLISGMDLPLKTQDEIHDFFLKNEGKEFMYIDEEAVRTRSFYFRSQYYHFFINLSKDGRSFFGRVCRLLDKVSVKIQEILHLCRTPVFPLYKGANWFSITDDLLQYVLSNEDAIRKQFDYSIWADEVFLQSVAMGSHFSDRIVNNCLRAVDWERGLPYTFRKEDVPMLLASDNLWGRKFDQRVDGEAIKLIAAHFRNAE